MVHLGFYLCFFGLVLSGYSMWVSLLSLRLVSPAWRARRAACLWQLSSHRAMLVSCVAVMGAAFILWYLLWQRDYSVEYIYKNSSHDLPPWYTITAFWSSLEGSHLLWSLILALVSGVAISTIPRNLQALRPYLHLFISGVMVWMYLLLVTFSDPFKVQLPQPSHGAGMNALLQNPYMAIHPPLLFMGYTALVVPYAYSMAALGYGAFLPAWSMVMRRWALIAWSFLTLGICLGGRWAYVELGWGGYWAWDPVENSSLIPWLLTTALIHGCVIQAKTGKLSQINILLSILAFFFSFFGTFLTRSGIVVSVHSFAQSSIGKIYVVFLAILFGVSLWIYLLRKHTLNSRRAIEIHWGISRELMMIGGIFGLVVLAAIVTLGTLYPIISEMIGGVKVNVQAPYFNTFAPWFGGAFALLMAFGALLRYHQARLHWRWAHWLSLVGTSMGCASLFAWISGVFASDGYRFSAQMIGSTLVFFAALCLGVDLYSRLKVYILRRDPSASFISSYGSMIRVFLSKNLAYLGGLIAHLGFLVALLGWLGNYGGLEQVMRMEPNQPVNFMHYSFEYLGMDQVKQDNATLLQAAVMVKTTKPGYPDQFEQILSPARSSYPTYQELLHEVEVMSDWWRDIYLVLAELPNNQDQAISIKLYYNPLVKLVWWSVVMMVMGGVMAGLGSRQRPRDE